MKVRPVLALSAAALISTLPLGAFAQDSAIFALDTTQDRAFNSEVNEDIIKAMQALEEAEAVLKAEQSELDALIAAAESPAPQMSPASAVLPEAKAEAAQGSEHANLALLAAAERPKSTAKAAEHPRSTPEVAAQEALAQALRSDKRVNLSSSPFANEASLGPRAQASQPKAQDLQGQATGQVSERPQARPRAFRPQSAGQEQALAYVLANYRVNGVDLEAFFSDKQAVSIAGLYQHAFQKGLVYHSTEPAIGDLVFFHNSYDRNRDGLWNDWHSLIGIVESIDENSTISVLVYQNQAIERLSLNLKYPELAKAKRSQAILNSSLRPDEGQHRGTAAKLFGGFANLLGDVESLNVIDNWHPKMQL